MKTDPLHLRPLSALFAVIGIACLLCLTGCTTAGLAKKIDAFEKAGVTQAIITGKFSHTEYTVERTETKRRAVLQHSNAWLPKVVIVTERENK